MSAEWWREREAFQESFPCTTEDKRKIGEKGSPYGARKSPCGTRKSPYDTDGNYDLIVYCGPGNDPTPPNPYKKGLRESLKDKESFQYKIKTLGNRLTRLQGICNSRAQETIAAREECDKWKEEVKVIESKMNLTSSRLKAEVDAHRDTKESLNTTFKQLVEVQGSIDNIRGECNEIISKNRVEEENLKKKEKIQ